MTTTQISLPAGFQLVANNDGSFTVVAPSTTRLAGGVIAGLHSALSTAGAQIPTALAAPIAASLTPTAITSAINVAGDIATGNYAGAAMTGIPLLLGVISAGYAVFTKTQEPTNAQIQTYIARLTRAQLIGLLNTDPGDTGAATNSPAAVGATEQPIVQPVAAAL